MNWKEIKFYVECNVFIVDDELMSCMLFEFILELVFICVIVELGEEVIFYCEVNFFDLVLFDMNMLDISGLDVCIVLKVLFEMNYIFVIFVIFIMDIESENVCWEVGVLDFVMKLVNVFMLMYCIKIYL